MTDQLAITDEEMMGFGIPLKDFDALCILRNLLKVKVTAQDVAVAFLFQAADRSANTTGAIIPVDGRI